jgi:hypothetical protein
MVIRDEDGHFEAIGCDAKHCEARSPEGLIPGGLIGLGWYCSGGKHLCSVHAPREKTDGHA